MIYRTPPTDFQSTFATVALYLAHEGRILVVQRNAEKKSNPSKWGIPTGKVETGETIEQAALRELLEETGITILPDRLIFLGTSFVRYPKADFTFHQFLIQFDEEPLITLNNENVALRWVDQSEIGSLDLVQDQNEAFRQFFAGNYM